MDLCCNEISQRHPEERGLISDLTGPEEIFVVVRVDQRILMSGSILRLTRSWRLMKDQNLGDVIEATLCRITTWA